MVKNIHIDLDDEQIYQRFDSDNMLKHIRNFPRLCSQAWQLAENLSFARRLSEDK